LFSGPAPMIDICVLAGYVMTRVNREHFRSPLSGRLYDFSTIRANALEVIDSRQVKMVGLVGIEPTTRPRHRSRSNRYWLGKFEPPTSTDVRIRMVARDGIEPPTSNPAVVTRAVHRGAHGSDSAGTVQSFPIVEPAAMQSFVNMAIAWLKSFVS